MGCSQVVDVVGGKNGKLSDNARSNLRSGCETRAETSSPSRSLCPVRYGASIMKLGRSPNQKTRNEDGICQAASADEKLFYFVLDGNW